MIASDIAPPTSGKLSILRDARVAQYWDRRRAVSQDIVRAVLARRSRSSDAEQVDRRTVIWDSVVLFGPGVRWDGDIPEPLYHGEPVIRAVPDLERTLANLTHDR